MIRPGPPLISAAEVRRRDDPVTRLDVRWSLTGPPGRDAYAAGHVPGALFVDLDRDLAGAPGPGGRHPLPDPEEFRAAMVRLGVDDRIPVVAYDHRDATAAARLWWLLRWLGHQDVRVLDGGYEAWVAAGGRVETGWPDPSVEPATTGPAGRLPAAVTAARRLSGEPGAMPVVSADEAAVLAREGVLLDARTAVRFRGEQEPVDRVAGHVPGAVSAPTSDNVGPDGRFRSAAELRERFASMGIDGTRGVGAYCGSGVTAAHEVLALEVAGIPAALWPGSWSEWVADPDRPIATGP